MSDKEEVVDGAGEGKPANSGDDSGSNEDLFNTRVQQAIEEQLRPIKGNLDAAYAARDEALRKLAEIERVQREKEVARLRDEGKHKEAYEAEIAAERARSQALEEHNIRLTRDIEVKNAMGNLPFRSENASDMAFKEVTGQLVRNEKGEWVHKSGAPIKDFVKAFADDEDNAFLFKSKASTGTGSPSNSAAPAASEGNKSLFAMSQDEVLRLAEEGKLGRGRPQP